MYLICFINMNSYANDTFDIEFDYDVYYLGAYNEEDPLFDPLYITARIGEESDYADPDEWDWDSGGLQYEVTEEEDEYSTLKVWADTGDAGLYEVSVEALSEYGEPDSYSCLVYTIETDLDIDSDGDGDIEDDEDEPGEEDPGCYIAVGGDRKLLKFEVQPIEELEYFCENGGLGFVAIEITDGTECARLYCGATGGNPYTSIQFDLSSGTDYQLLQAFINNGLYIGATDASSSTQDIEVTLFFYARYPDDYWFPVHKDKVNFTSINIDVNIGLTDAQELDPGKYINVNWDDDDNDGWTDSGEPPDAEYTGDKDDSEIPENGDEDLRPFTVSISLQEDIEEAFPSSTIIINYPEDKVKVWQTNTKTFSSGGENSFVHSGVARSISAFPAQYYLEGISGSSNFRDVELKATWSVDSSIKDIVKITVFELYLTGFFSYGNQQNDNDKKMHNFLPGSSDKCGMISWDDANGNGTPEGSGDMDSNCRYFGNCMELQGTVNPSGVTNEVEFNFEREKYGKEWKKIEGDESWSHVHNWSSWDPDDMANDEDEDVSPDNDHIYQLDIPGFLVRLRTILDIDGDYKALVINLKQRVMVKIDGVWYQCSNYYKWHSQTYTKPKDSTYMTRDDVNKQKLGSGWISIPTNP